MKKISVLKLGNLDKNVWRRKKWIDWLEVMNVHLEQLINGLIIIQASVLVFVVEVGKMLTTMLFLMSLNLPSQMVRFCQISDFL